MAFILTFILWLFAGCPTASHDYNEKALREAQEALEFARDAGAEAKERMAPKRPAWRARDPFGRGDV